MEKHEIYQEKKPVRVGAADLGTVRRMRVRIGLLGYGNVGAPLAELIDRARSEVAQRTGVELEVTRIAVRDLDKDRPVPLPAGLGTTDAAGLANGDDVDLVVEVMGAIEPAHALLAGALASGKPVVTANKELMAAHGRELLATADGAGVDLLFEAAVGGGIPFVRPLRESLMGERIRRVMGIVNGTTNYILDQMTAHGTSYADALAEAQRLGYAEPDPTADVEGHDSAAKAAIIASIAFGAAVTAADVYCEGISDITADDIVDAARLGFVIKLLAITEPTDTGIGVRVHPAMVPVDHPLASVHDSFNAVFVEGESVGDLMFYGRGAGSGPTSSALLGDIIDAAVNLSKGAHASVGTLNDVAITPIDDVVGAHSIQIRVDDQPGVLAEVAGAFGAHGVSIRSMEQEGMGSDARLVFITHEAREADVRATLDDLGDLESVTRIGSVLRVIGADE